MGGGKTQKGYGSEPGRWALAFCYEWARHGLLVWGEGGWRFNLTGKGEKRPAPAPFRTTEYLSQRMRGGTFETKRTLLTEKISADGRKDETLKIRRETGEKIEGITGRGGMRGAT